MRRITAAAVVVLGLAILGSCAKDINFRNLGKQELVIIRIRMDPATKTCKLEQRKPAEIRTDAGSRVEWFFVGGCEGQPTVGIRSVVMKDGRPFELFDLSHADTKLEDKAPGPGSGTPARLTAVLKGNVEKGRYTYQVLIGGKPAEFNSPAEEGDFFACPVWPCGGFLRY